MIRQLGVQLEASLEAIGEGAKLMQTMSSYSVPRCNNRLGLKRSCVPEMDIYGLRNWVSEAIDPPLPKMVRKKHLAEAGATRQGGTRRR